MADDHISQLDFQKIMVVLSEKRTAHTTLRTGIAVCVFSLTIISFSIAIISSLNLASGKILFTLFYALCGVMLAFGIYLIHRGLVRITFHDRVMTSILGRNHELATVFYSKQRSQRLKKELALHPDDHRE